MIKTLNLNDEGRELVPHLKEVVVPTSLATGVDCTLLGHLQHRLGVLTLLAQNKSEIDNILVTKKTHSKSCSIKIIF